MMDSQTRRESIRQALKLSIDGATPDDLRDHLYAEHGADLSETEVLNELDHVRQSLKNEDIELLVRPPECRDCGFDRFDNHLNVPSRCPQCRSEWIAPPAYLIDDT